MIAELGIVSRILFKMLEFLGFRYISNKQKIDNYLVFAILHIDIIIETEVYPNEKAAHSHEIIKKLYDEASSDIGNIIAANDFEKIMQGLSAARIYYWVRHFRNKPTEEIKNLINRRIERIKQGSVRHHSLEYIVKKVRDLKSSDIGEEKIIEAVYENAHADIYEIKKLNLKIAIT